jgi:cytochrome c oxidase subunit 3
MSSHDQGSKRPVFLQHHFFTPEQQRSAAKMGMWLFLATEILFFGGLFMFYTIVRILYPDTFLDSHEHLNKIMGAINTVVLITSSLTMALAVRAAQTNKRTALIINLFLTLAFAGTFMVIKYFEYSHKIHDCLLPGNYFCDRDLVTGLCHPSCSVAAELGGMPHIFFAVYFIMTGMHGLHVVIGMGVIIWMIIGAYKNKYSSEYYTPVENVGLYWHLVDLIWIFLFPLLYLVR